MSFYIVGTAGHIDHGKTELSKALTGIQTDRLKEEQQRGMSIKLGFAPLVLNETITLGLVDVPGHEKFIQQMLSGASGMDLVLIVISATEGIMPQTKEHIDIISLLGIKNIIVALTKKSLVDDDFLELVTDDVRDYLKKRDFIDTPIIAVDSITLDGIAELKTRLQEMVENLPPKELGNFPRLPIDRVFTLQGHGTIVTGTLWSGEISKGDMLKVFPIDQKVKVRNVQVHNNNVETAFAGQRVALNLPDLSINEIPSGSVLLKENIIQPTFKVSGIFNLLKDKHSMHNLEKVRIHLGTGETSGKLILLESDEIYPGEKKLAGLYLDNPLGTILGDTLIIRKENGSETLGGFRIIEVFPSKFKRLDKSFITDLKKKAEGSLDDKLLAIISRFPFITLSELSMKMAISKDEIKELVNNNIDLIIEFENQYLILEKKNSLIEEIVIYLRSKLAQTPLVVGVSKEEIRSKFFKDYSQKTFNGIIKIIIGDKLELVGEIIKETGYNVSLTDEDTKIIDRILTLYNKDGLNSKNIKETSEFLKMPVEIYLKYHNFLLETGKLVKIDENIYLSSTVYEEAIKKIIDYFLINEFIEISSAKDLLNTSRKYIVPFLEHLDYKKITRRVENKRVLTRR
ncbi:MAG: selenocysteine-specific translation elongation factor [Firmicutes bacterium]|nr:selenocysteine-specific translation elongation factor [Bacillota bacterium]